MKNSNVAIIMVTAALLMLGVIMVYSASAIYAYEKLKNAHYFLERHLIFLLIALVAALAVMHIDYTILQRKAKLILCISLASLLFVLIPHLGHQSQGAQRWFRIFGISFQPTEFAKIGFIIYIADFFSRKEAHMKEFARGFLPVLFLTGAFVGLMLLQPDFGSSVVLCGIMCIMAFVAGIPLTFLFAIVVPALPVLAYLVISKPYRMARILAFLNPWADPRGVGYQIIQSFLAFGSGGFFGLGLGHSRQKLFYLPHAHTDFIFSIIGEELGFLGVVVVIALFSILIFYGFKIALKTMDRFGSMLALGLSSMIGIEVFLNIAVVTGLLPTKGLPLPFVSYGGSSLLFKIIAIALLLNIGRAKPKIPL